MAVFRTNITIPAPPSAVWAVLTDLPRWPEWNPLQPGFEVSLQPGSRGRIAVQLGGRTRWATVRLVTVESERTLSWEGGVRGVFHAIHGFDLRPDGDGTYVEHVEVFSGVVPLVGASWLEQRLMPRYRRVNQALSDRVHSVGSEQ
jgi:hypothetical protein